MYSLRFILLIGTALLALPAMAWAQTPPPAPAPSRGQGQGQGQPAPRPPAAAVEDVTVTGRNTDIRSSIDSTSYSLADDLQARTGALADALRNIPSVDVDPLGNVSLRGDASVTILVDGRPSGVLSGESRAQAVLQLPADQYVRIEVMTNPSAAYSPEGTGGVINLITKPPVVRPGATITGSARANIGGDGRYNFGASGVFSKDRLTLSGDAGYRYEALLQEVDRLRERLDPGSGQFLESRQSQDVDAPIESLYGRFTAEYRLTDRTRVTGELRGNDFTNTGTGVELFEGENVAGLIDRTYRRDSEGGYQQSSTGGTGRVLHRFNDQGHEWSTEFRADRGRNDFEQATVTHQTLPPGPDVYERVESLGRFTALGFTSAYVRPTTDGGRFRAGYELEMQLTDTRNAVSRGPTATGLTPDPLVTNRFEAEQAVHAVYGTWERPLGKWTVQGGLRLEYAAIDLNQITGGIRASNDYFRVYPTVHLGYQLTEDQTLRASYSRRVQRPQPNDLNPFLTFQDPFNYRSGNPDLEPNETDSFEVIWQRRVRPDFYQATLYYRDRTKAFTQVAKDIGGGVFVTRPENLGSRRDIGLELTANGGFHPTLRYNASVNVFYREINTAGVPGARNSAGTAVTARGNLNWQPTADDFLQLAALWQSESVQAQGVNEANGTVNLGYRRKLSEKLAFQATVRNLFESFGDVRIIDTPTFRDRTERIFGGRTWFIGLTWSFGQGSRRPQEPQFDFSGPNTGG